MKAKLLLPQPVLPAAFGDAAKGWPQYKHDKRFVVAPAGTIVEGPDAWRLVKVGSCAPADAECRARAGMTDEQVLAQYRKYVKLEKAQFTGDPKFDAPDSP